VKAALWTTLAAIVAATALAAPASAATPTERKLNKQVKTLQAQVKKMQKQVKTLQTQMKEVQSIAAGALIYSACLTASTADAFQGTWESIDKVGAGLSVPQDQYPAQAAIADPLNSCQRLEIQRAPNIVPPTTNVFAALLNVFR
jgi:hypothetical protein